ncbi:unnamed protein product, partial [marine sediment metagenome]
IGPIKNAIEDIRVAKKKSHISKSGHTQKRFK